MINEFTGSTLSAFMGFLAVMNPIANLPVFLGLTQDDDEQTRRKVAKKALIFTFIIILVFTIGGKLIFDLFGISLPAFRITGGLLVMMIGFQMLHGEQSRLHHPRERSGATTLQSPLEVAITPLSIPILAGPGTIATAINYASTGGIKEYTATLAGFAVLCFITYGFFVTGEKFARFIGDSGIRVITQIMGLILAVIGTQMLIDGVAGAVSLMGQDG